MQVDFYQLGGAPLERVLPRIAERLLADGQRLLVVTGDPVAAARLDQTLWTYRDDAFLPHGLADADGAADQPVLIATGCDPVNGARHVALVDGIWRDAALAFERVFHFFDESGVEAARAAWRGLAGRDGVGRDFWRQDEDGRWEKLA